MSGEESPSHQCSKASVESMFQRDDFPDDLSKLTLVNWMNFHRHCVKLSWLIIHFIEILP